MPELETARLLLRPLVQDDLIAHHRMVGSDPQVTWHGKALTLEESQAALDKRIRHWQEHGFGMWAVIEKDTSTLLGHCGLQRLEQTEDIELGYYLGRPAWGKGFASGAGGAAVRWDFEQLQLPYQAADVRFANTASQHVLRKLGFCHTGTAQHYGFEVQYWRMERADFQPTAAVYQARS